MTARIALALPALALVAAGCGGVSRSPGVASLGSPATTTTAGGSSGGPADGGGGGTISMQTGDGRAFAACMRAHGVPNFPDPNSQGAITISPGSGIDPGSPTFNAAQQRCGSRLSDLGHGPSPQQEARMRAGALAFSACMRKHGVADFPDPTFPDGGVRLKITAGSGSDVDPRSPAFQAAQKACNATLPGRVAVGTAIGK